MFETGFIWTDNVIIAIVVCAVLAIAAVALFLVFGKKQEQLSGGVNVLEDLQRFPLAVVGSFLRGPNKEVGSQEFIATLMALAHAGFLSIENDEKGEDSALCIGDAHEWEIEDPLDKTALELLLLFAEDDGRVQLSSAKEIGAANKEKIDTAYRGWRQCVKSTAEQRMAAHKTALSVQKGMLYVGYACIVLALASAYFLSLLVSLILLVTGGLLIVLSLIMRRNTHIERQNARKLYVWMGEIAVHAYDLPTDRKFVQLLLEYACLFALADKVSAALLEEMNSPVIEEEVATLGFWKQLKAALYTTE